MKIGLQELLLIFIVALFVLGPDKLPYYAKKLGEALGEFRKFSGDATKEIRESIVEPLEEAQKPLREAMEPVTEFEKSVKQDVREIKKSFSDIEKGKISRTKEEKNSDPESPEEETAARDSQGKEKSSVEGEPRSAEATFVEKTTEQNSDVNSTKDNVDMEEINKC